MKKPGEAPLIAFHGEPGIKDRYLARVRLHREADRLVRGRGWEGGRGCAVGCTLESYDHSRYPIELGIPVELAHLEDRIFENLPHAEALQWPERFLDAATPGADLSRVWPLFAVWLLTDDACGVIQYAKTEAQRASIQAVADLYREGVPSDDRRWAAAAAYAYAYAADAYAAAYDAAYAAATCQPHWRHCADKLIELMASCMTARERAAAAVGLGCGLTGAHATGLMDAIERAITAAVKEHRARKGTP